MRVSLIKTTKIIDIILPNNPTGNYWITDFDDDGHEKNLICIEGNKKNWIITSNEEYGYVENNLSIFNKLLRHYAIIIDPHENIGCQPHVRAPIPNGLNQIGLNGWS